MISTAVCGLGIKFKEHQSQFKRDGINKKSQAQNQRRNLFDKWKHTYGYDHQTLAQQLGHDKDLGTARRCSRAEHTKTVSMGTAIMWIQPVSWTFDHLNCTEN